MRESFLRFSFFPSPLSENHPKLSRRQQLSLPSALLHSSSRFALVDEPLPLRTELKKEGRERGERRTQSRTKKREAIDLFRFDLLDNKNEKKMASSPYQPAEVSGPHPVLLHVYDVTNASSNAINATVSGLNRLTKDVLGLGGVFHGGKSFFFYFGFSLFLSTSTSTHGKKKLKMKETQNNKTL